MLHDLNLGDANNIGTQGGQIALDCSVRRTRQGHFCISTTDFFFPLVDSPYWQGYIGAANVLSDLYAQGIMECDFMLMLLAASRDMPDDMRRVCTAEMVKGFRDACRQADCPITGGQTVLNPWPIIGGVATSIVSEGEFVPSDGAQPGDVLVLTKPLGTQVAVNVHQWRQQAQALEEKEGEDARKASKSFNVQLWNKCLDDKILTLDQASTLLHEAVCSMARLNHEAGRLLIPHEAHAATDVTGFGILGHAQNLVENQKLPLAMEIHTLPCLAHAVAVNDDVLDFQLRKGYSAETSGGLLICMPPETAEAYCRQLQELEGCPAWIIGTVAESKTGKSQATLTANCKILEVE